MAGGIAAELRGSVRRGVPKMLKPAAVDIARQVSQEPLFRAAAVEGPPRGRCINVGSGTGIYSGFLESFEAVSEIVNLDLTPPGISSRRADERHTDVVGSVTEMPFEDGSFDWILCTNVLPCIPDDRAAAVELRRILRPDGFALISVRTPDAPTPRKDPIRREEGYRIVHDYTLEQLGDVLAQANLEIVWHGSCCHLLMKWLVSLWRSRYVHIGPGGRSVLPRLLVLAFGYADRWLPIGPAWDLTVLARPISPPAS